MTFFSHFFKFLSIKSVDVELEFLEIIPSKENCSRKEIASIAFSAINSAYSD